MHFLKRPITTVLVFLLCAGVGSAAPKFPFKSPYKASLLSAMPTPKYPETVEKVTVKPGVTLNIRFQRDVQAPLLFILPGLGGTTTSGLSEILAHQAYLSGYHTINLINPVHPSFVSSISDRGFVGNFFYDMADLTQMMRSTVKGLKAKIQPRFYSLVGFSLGGSLVPLLEMEDRRDPFFNFKQVIMLNPGASISFAVTTIDELYRTKVTARDGLAKSIIGKNFRKSLFRVIQATKKRNLISEFHSISKPTELDFENYLNNRIGTLSIAQDHRFFKTGEKFSDSFDFVNYTSLFSGNTKFVVVHNRDDFMLRGSDIKFYEKYFKGRLKFFNYGGHCGNYWVKEYQENFRKIISFGK